MQSFLARFSSSWAPEPASPPLDGVPGLGEVDVGGRRCVTLAANDPLALATDARVREAASAALRRYGTACDGTTKALIDLETTLARHLARPAAVVAADWSELWPSLWLHAEQIHLARALPDAWHAGLPHAAFGHLLELENALPRLAGTSIVVAVPGVTFGRGDLANLPRVEDLARRADAALVVDESLGLGVLGANGRGALEHLDCAPESLVVASLGPLGGSGVVCAGPEAIVSRLRRVPTRTLPPPALLAAALRGLELVASEPHRRARVLDAAERLHRGLRSLGLDTGPSVTHVVPVWVGDEARCERLRTSLLEAGLAVGAWLAPGRSRLVLIPQATHTDDQLDQAVELVERLARRAGMSFTPPPSSVEISLARPKTYAQTAACGAHWEEPAPTEDEQTNLVGELLQSAARGMPGRVLAAVETLTWRAVSATSIDVRRWLRRK